jgi:hypothetical protein
MNAAERLARHGAICDRSMCILAENSHASVLHPSALVLSFTLMLILNSFTAGSHYRNDQNDNFGLMQFFCSQ